MDISGKSKLWINKNRTRDGNEFSTYNVSVNKKKQDGAWVSAYIKARFAKSVYIPDGVTNGTMMDFSGFLTVDSYTDREGKEVNRPMVMITEATFSGLTKTDSFSEAEDDIPF